MRFCSSLLSITAFVLLQPSFARGSAAPPSSRSITLELSEELVQQLHSTETDAAGVPCRSTGADQGSCGKHAGHVQYYASCNVLLDNGVTCPEPEASAHDHHEGAIPIKKTVRLYVESPKQQPAKLVDRVVSAVSYTMRGEYTLTYDAADSSGNAADSVVFHFFLVDHSACCRCRGLRLTRPQVLQC